MLDLVINGRFLSQPATGVQRVAREFVRALDRLLGEGRLPHVQARLVAQDDADPAPLELRHVTFDAAPGARGHLWEQRVLPHHVRGGTLLCLGNSAPLANLLSDRPVGVMLHDQAHLLFPRDYSRSYRLAHRLLEACIVRRARPLILVSESERHALAQRRSGLPPNAIVAPNGSWMDDRPVGFAPPASRLSSPRGYGLFVGTLNGRKNIDGIIATAVRLARERNHRFRFVGPQPDARSVADRIPADLRPLIQFTGYAADGELPELYRNAAYLLYPSFYEASGLPPSEAMTFGCPVVASDLPVLRERCGAAAIYCNPHDPVSIHDAVAQILDHPERAAALTQHGLEQASRFTWRRQALLIVEALERASNTALCHTGRRSTDIRPSAVP